jgi:long-chain fatty acid transport protein
MLVGMSGENGLAHIAIDCTQTGWGLTPILGVDFKWRGLTLAAKYEFKTNLNIENDTKKATAEPAAFEAALDDYKHGVNTPNDLPAVLYTALGYEFIPNKLRATVEYHYYDDKHAEMAHDKQKHLKHGTHEVLAGVEWDINKMFTVSAGAQNTDYGLSDAYQTHTSFSCDSYSIGFGGAVNLSEKVKLNVGYFWTTYKDYKRNEPENYFNTTLPGSDTYSRTNKVFGAGIDFKF